MEARIFREEIRKLGGHLTFQMLRLKRANYLERYFGSNLAYFRLPFAFVLVNNDVTHFNPKKINTIILNPQMNLLVALQLR